MAQSISLQRVMNRPFVENVDNFGQTVPPWGTMGYFTENATCYERGSRAVRVSQRRGDFDGLRLLQCLEPHARRDAASLNRIQTPDETKHACACHGFGERKCYELLVREEPGRETDHDWKRVGDDNICAQDDERRPERRRRDTPRKVQRFAGAHAPRA